MSGDNPFLNMPKLDNSGAPPKDLLDMLVQAVGKFVDVIGKPLGIQPSSLGKTSVLANLNIEQGAALKVDSKIMGDKVLGIAGDTKPALAEFLANSVQLSSIRDIKAEAPSYGDSGGNNVSWSDLGGISPSAGYSGGGSGGHEL
jgi:hypothetical protein